jgi:predicted nucleic acid-binding protein
VGPVVIDTNILVRAVLSSSGARRKLWLLLVYGGAVERMHRIREEQRAAEERGGGLGSHSALEEAEASVARIAEQLPVGAPDGWWTLTSPTLLDEYHRKLHALREELARPPLTVELVDAAHRAVIASCGYVTPEFDPSTVPLYTEGRDRDDDAVIHTAMLGKASVLLSDNTRDISLDADGTTEYESEDGHIVHAMTFGYFTHTHLDFDLDHIDGTVLPLAYGGGGGEPE